MRIVEDLKVVGDYDVVVAGGGVAGIAAAVSVARQKKRCLIIEKTVNFGGLATNGLVNFFVPMCNGRGVNVFSGLANEFLELSYKYGWTNIKDCWLKNEKEKTGRLVAHFSPAIFALTMTELLKNEGVEILFDTLVTDVLGKNSGNIDGVIIESKSGREIIRAKMYVDTTGDADLLYRAGVPVKDGTNFLTYSAMGMDLDSMKNALDDKKINKAYKWYMGGRANLYGGNHPENEKLYGGTDKESVTEYAVKNQLLCLDGIKGKDKDSFDITVLPSMVQFRTTRHLVGDKVFSEKNAYVHFPDSVCVINDFDRKDYIYEVQYGCLVKTGFENIITAGRCASTEDDYSWDVLRVIPPAIMTGQVAGIAACVAIDSNKPIYKIDVEYLQRLLKEQGVCIHFDDELIPKDQKDMGQRVETGHI